VITLYNSTSIFWPYLHHLHSRVIKSTFLEAYKLRVVSATLSLKPIPHLILISRRLKSIITVNLINHSCGEVHPYHHQIVMTSSYIPRRINPEENISYKQAAAPRQSGQHRPTHIRQRFPLLNPLWGPCVIDLITKK